MDSQTPEPDDSVIPAEDEGVERVLRAGLEERLAAYKVPRIYQLVEELPKGATGKILKRALDRPTIATSGERPARATTPTT